MRDIQYGKDKDHLITERLDKLKKMIQIVELCDNDFERALELRRIYSNYHNFAISYYKKCKKKDQVEKVLVLNSEFEKYSEELTVLSSLFKRYEEEGFFELAKKEDVFLIRQAGNLDSRYIINAYIEDGISYDQNAFFLRYRIDLSIFLACVTRIKTHDKELYAKYLEAVNNNKTRRLVMPIYSINQIIEGITTGKTIDGNKFDIYEFYRLVPFKGKDIDDEVRFISKDFPKLLIFKNLKQELVNKKREEAIKQGKETPKLGCTYAENLYLFTRCFSKRQADILKDYMEKNNVKNLTPIHRASTVNFYFNTPDDAEFNMNDAINIFDTMDEMNLPYYREVYNLLKEENLNKKLMIENK